MRYRRLSPTGDYSFGQGAGNFLVDTPACVAQAVMTRLKLIQGEWFLDSQVGTPWFSEVLGNHTQGLRDAAIRQAVENTPGVTAITEYESQVDADDRTFTVRARVETAYGAINFGTTS